MNTYKEFLRPFLFRLDAETAHNLAMLLASGACKVPVLLESIARACQVHDNRLSVKIGELTFPNPVGLAAGLDKNAVAIPLWQALGFGGVEIGTVTSSKQVGNDKPRMWRSSEHQALVNCLGFPNDGSEAIAGRIKSSGRNPKVPLGINFGKAKSIPVEDEKRVIGDYLYTLLAMNGLGDYYTLNASSPNTPGLRELLQPKRLRPLLREIQGFLKGKKPLIVKLFPGMDRQQVHAVMQLCQEHGVAAVIYGNTSTDVTLVPGLEEKPGGRSGKVIHTRAVEEVRYVTKTFPDMPIIGCGGIFDGADARDFLEAGAAMVQLYTGMVFEGPTIAHDINRVLQSNIDARQYQNVREFAQAAA